jgi:carbonic anhydrase
MFDDLLRGHRHFRRKFLANERAFLQKLASEGQSPGAVYIGCSDSRVVPELLTSTSPGEIFVVRNIANLIPTFEHADASVGAALDYAIGHLKVEHVIVCGHYGCGGVKGAMEGGHFHGHDSLEEWLAPLVPVTARVRCEDPARWWKEAVEESVIQQLENLSTYPIVKSALEQDAITLHAWVYDLFTLNLFVYDVDSEHFAPADGMLKGRL